MGADEKTLGKRLQAARKRAGLTQEELCQKTGLSYSTLAKIERGAIKSPSIFTVAAIAKATGATFEQLLGIKAIAGEKKTSKSGIKFVYFDVNGVLVRFYHRAFTKIAHEAKVPVDTVETFFWRQNDQLCHGKLSLEEFNQSMSKEFHLTNFDWLKEYLQAIEPTSGIKELVEWAAKHYEIGLITNSLPGVLEKLRTKGLVPRVNYKAVIDSSKVGMVKPSPKIFELAQKTAGVKPEEILLIDDDKVNSMAADKLGWRVQWFDDYQYQDCIKRAKDTLAF